MWCMSHLCEYPRRPKEGVVSPGAEVTGSYKMPQRGNVGPLEEKQVCLATEPFLQHLPLNFEVANQRSLTSGRKEKFS